ncbi:MAG: nuclear transport factor 2 family protein [Bacteroidota bacterium]
METLAAVKSEKNISIVQKAFADFLSGDIGGILEVCTEDIVWASYDNAVVPFGRTYHGKKGTAEFFTTLGSTVDYKTFEPREYFADKDSVFVRGYQEATVKSTGKTFAHDFLMHFRLEDGLVSYFFSFVDSKDEAEAFQS